METMVRKMLLKIKILPPLIDVILSYVGLFLSKTIILPANCSDLIWKNGKMHVLQRIPGQKQTLIDIETLEIVSADRELSHSGWNRPFSLLHIHDGLRKSEFSVYNDTFFVTNARKHPYCTVNDVKYNKHHGHCEQIFTTAKKRVYISSWDLMICYRNATEPPFSFEFDHQWQTWAPWKEHIIGICYNWNQIEVVFYEIQDNPMTINEISLGEIPEYHSSIPQNHSSIPQNHSSSFYLLTDQNYIYVLKEDLVFIYEFPYYDTKEKN
jgi:hypothetical protein